MRKTSDGEPGPAPREASGGGAGPGRAASPQALSDWEVERLAEHLDGLLERLLARGDEELAAAVAGLVEGLERIHAEGLRRLAEIVGRDAEQLRRAERDPVIASLFELYDLSVDRGVRGLDPGGVSPTGDVSVVPRAKLVQLRRRLDRPRDAAGDGSADRASPRIGTFPLSELGEAGVAGVTIGRTPVLLVRRGDEIHAYRNACPGTPLPLHLGRLEGDELLCPWHGCRFEVGTGARGDAEGGSLAPLEARVSDGQVRVVLR